MKKKILCLVLALVMLLSVIPVSAFAAQAKRQLGFEEKIATELKKLNLFKGVSDTDFALGRVPSRFEALVIMLRLMGKEAEILAGEYKHPFTDVPAWADKYVGYAYENKLTNGISETQFGASDATDVQFMTFVLRAMNYSDANGDFTWDNPYDLAKKLGVLTTDVVTGSSFLRADCVTISFNALSSKLKDSNKTLAEKLISNGVFTKDKYNDALANIIEMPVLKDVDFTTLLNEINKTREETISKKLTYAGFDNYIYPIQHGIISKAEIDALKENSKGKNVLTQAEAISDVDLLFRAYKYAYGAYGYFGEENFNNSENNIKEKLSKVSTITRKELEKLLFDNLSWVADAHFVVAGDHVIWQHDDLVYQYYYTNTKFNKDSQGYYTVIDNTKWYYDSCSSTGVRVLPTLRTDGHIEYSPVRFCVLSEYEKSGTLNLINGTQKKSITVSWTPAKKMPGDKQVYTFNRVDDFVYVTNRRLHDAPEDEMTAFSKTGLQAKNANIIVVDIRGHGGGNSTYATDWIKNAFGVQPHMKRHQIRKETPLGNFGNVTYGSEKIRKIYDNGTFIHQDALVVVLVDAGVGSTGEWFLNELKTMSNVIVVGTNSLGCECFGNVSDITLPNSGIYISFGSDLRAWDDNCTNIEGRGFEPDVWCDPITALTAVKNMLIKNNLMDSSTVKELFGTHK